MAFYGFQVGVSLEIAFTPPLDPSTPLKYLFTGTKILVSKILLSVLWGKQVDFGRVSPKQGSIASASMEKFSLY